MELNDYYLAVKALKAPEGLSKAAAATWLQISTDKLRKSLTTDQMLMILKDKADFSKGKQLFDGYTREHSPYEQTLMTALITFGEEYVYSTLAKADRLGKLVALIESTAVQGRPTGLRVV